MDSTVWTDSGKRLEDKQENRHRVFQGKTWPYSRETKVNRPG